jgi:predicted nucleic-acid-binding protein
LIALDTNILVRFITGDDPAQARIAQTLLGDLTPDAPGFVCREVLIEFVWVLSRTYRFSRAAVSEAVLGLICADALKLELEAEVRRALEIYSASKADIADILIEAAGRRAGALEMVTFDRSAAQLDGVRLLEP